jgi:hypothetical protein
VTQDITPFRDRATVPAKRRVTESSFTPEIAERIAAEMADGRTLVAICRDPGMPAARTVRDWARGDVQGFQAIYARARELQAHAVAEMVLQDARDATDPQLGRLQMDAAKWYAAKLLPKVYSDRVAVDAKFELEETRTADEIAASVAARQARLMIEK